MTGHKEKKTSDRWSPEALRSIGRLDFIAREVLDGVRQGLHRSLRRGFSSEFFDYKNYEPGDDATKIDWRLYAKTGKYFIKRFEAETSLECMMLVDTSKSMHWKWEDSVSKKEYASILAASLGLLLTLQRDQVGLHTFGGLPQEHIKPKSSLKHISEFFSALAAPALEKEGPPLTECARGIGAIRRHKGLLILISDLEMHENEIRESISLLRSKGDELIVFHLLDKAEIDLPFSDATHIRDSETGELIPFNAPAVRASHKQRISDFRSLVKKICTENGAMSVPIDTSLSPVSAIIAMNEARKGVI